MARPATTAARAWLGSRRRGARRPRRRVSIGLVARAEVPAWRRQRAPIRPARVWSSAAAAARSATDQLARRRARPSRCRAPRRQRARTGVTPPAEPARQAASALAATATESPADGRRIERDSPIAPADYCEASCKVDGECTATLVGRVVVCRAASDADCKHTYAAPSTGSAGARGPLRGHERRRLRQEPAASRPANAPCETASASRSSSPTAPNIRCARSWACARRAPMLVGLRPTATAGLRRPAASPATAAATAASVCPEPSVEDGTESTGRRPADGLSCASGPRSD